MCVHMLPLRSNRQALIMKLSWLMIWAGTLFLNPVTADCNITAQAVTCEEPGKSLSHLPINLFQNVTKLSLKNIIITLNNSDKEILRSFFNLTELYLNENMIAVLYNNSFCYLTKLSILDISNNHISTVHKAAFEGLNQLSVLNLSYNMISQLDSNVFTSLKSLTVLNLQYNVLEYFNIKPSFKLIKIVLVGNPWTCSCDLLDLQIWLTASSVILDLPPGKSWTFLAGVLGFVLGTTLLIFTAVKCPTWYHYLISYSHRRLEENDPEMFEQEFSADMTSPIGSTTNNEGTIVIFEKNHEFAPVEDGFIEDKYIDSYVTEES
ncbi:leucine-rich repeat-containing protein 19 isoform X1 [Heliangelus exortis]|uniref:leucine-rich repeat-containing protein 19 isoform X1 n=1 Tax=Heliangelus exortis TaxID=472823 RepID=UPI003A8DEF9F